jgi:hypothetical protein
VHTGVVEAVAFSPDGRLMAIAAALGCSDKAARYRLARFAAEGLDGLGDSLVSGASAASAEFSARSCSPW